MPLEFSELFGTIAFAMFPDFVIVGIIVLLLIAVIMWRSNITIPAGLLIGFVALYGVTLFFEDIIFTALYAVLAVIALGVFAYALIQLANK